MQVQTSRSEGAEWSTVDSVVMVIGAGNAARRH
jgi:hypothetical protein